MASLSVSPALVHKGDNVVLSGQGFTGGATVVVAIPQLGIVGDTVADAAGYFGWTDIPDHALTTLTLSGNAVAAETITIGSVTYTWRASVTTTANEVLVGGTASASLDNLKSAVNASGGAVYGSLTVANPDVEAGAKTATTLKFNARVGGTAGNSLASTETMTNGSFPGTTFNSGTAGSAASANRDIVFTPDKLDPVTINASDGTNTASITFPVWA